MGHMVGKLRNDSKMAANLGKPSWITRFRKPQKTTKVSQKVIKRQRKTRKWYQNMKLTVTKLILYIETGIFLFLKNLPEEKKNQINFWKSKGFSRCLHHYHLHHPQLLLPLLLLLLLLICVDNNTNNNNKSYTTSLISFLFLLTPENRQLKKQRRQPQRQKKTFEI